MSGGASAQRQAPPGSPGHWFENPGSSPVDKLPAFREALADVARAWNEHFATLAATEGEIKAAEVTVCRVDEVLSRRTGASVLALLNAPGWNTQIGVGFDRVFVATMVEALFGGGGEDLAESARAPLSPVDLQIAEVITRQLADALAAGFAKRLPSSFKSAGLQWSKLDPSFLGKPNASVVIGTLELATLGGRVTLDVLVPLAAMMVFAEELAREGEADPAYGDPRWTQRLETEVSRASMRLTALVDLEPMTVGAIASLREGQLIELPRSAGQRVRLLCGRDDLFRCDLGQSDGFYTLRVKDTMAPAEDAPPPEAGLETSL
jgi:flagellar motor switch protein FliM